MSSIPNKKWTKEELISFEENIKTLFKQGKISCPIHLSGGNEEQLISLFSSIKPKDWVVSSHRNHYHYLLKGGDAQKLHDEILGRKSGICKGEGRSMHIYDKSINFLTSAIVGGGCAIAVGLALGLKKKRSKGHVWCFVGDGGEDTGHFMEAVRFGNSRSLPLTFIIEDNDLAVESTKEERWHNFTPMVARNIIRYNYVRRWPHVGVGAHVSM